MSLHFKDFCCGNSKKKLTVIFNHNEILLGQYITDYILPLFLKCFISFYIYSHPYID